MHLFVPSRHPARLSPIFIGFTLVFWITLPASTRADPPPVEDPPVLSETPKAGLVPPPVAEDEKPMPAVAAPVLPALTGTRLSISRFTSLTAGVEELEKVWAVFNSPQRGESRERLVALAATHSAARLWLFMLSAESGLATEVLAAIPQLKKDFPDLKDFLVLKAALVHWKTRNLEGALALAQLVATGPYAHEGLALQILIAREKQDGPQLEKVLALIVESAAVSRSEKAAFRVELATWMHKRKAPAEQWLPHLMWVWTNTPLSASSRAAEAMAQTFTRKGLPARATCAQKIERAQILADQMLHDATINTLTGVKSCTREEQCQMLYLHGRALSFQKKRKEAESVLFRAVTTCEKTKNLDLRVKAKYLSGRNARRQGKLDLAAAYYRRVHKEHPDHTYADDGLYHEALSWFSRKNPTRAVAVLRDLVKRHPRGDMADEARWRIVLADLEAGRWAAGVKSLASVRQSQVPTAPFEDWGRLLYWQGRCAQLTGDTAGARTFYAETVATAPVTYYALLALNRLEQLKTGDGTALLKKLMAATSPSAWPWATVEHADFAKPAFARLVQFARLGLSDEMDHELHLLDRDLPLGEIPDADRPFWRGMMFAYLLVGENTTAMRLQGRVLFDYAQGWPAANLRRLWEVAYPRPYDTETRAAAAKFGFNVHHLTGLTREESLFNATIRSSAGALGLGQLMPATARSYAARAGVAIGTDADLLVPKTNLLLAAAYLSKLEAQFNKNPILLTGAYNAGETAITRWRAQYAKKPVDLWVELLEVSETRNYIKRVLSSMFAYHLLAGEADFPLIPLD